MLCLQPINQTPTLQVVLAAAEHGTATLRSVQSWSAQQKPSHPISKVVMDPPCASGCPLTTLLTDQICTAGWLRSSLTTLESDLRTKKVFTLLMLQSKLHPLRSEAFFRSTSP